MALDGWKTRYRRWNRPTRLAFWITVGVLAWMATGIILPSTDAGEENTTLTDERDVSASISVAESVTVDHQRTLALNGVTEPNRVVGLKAQTSGAIIAFPVKEGAAVKAGQVLVEIELQNRPEQLRRSEALVKQREIEYDASKRLVSKGFTTEVRFAESKTLLEEARRELKQAQIDLKNTKIRAPFDGVLERLNAEVGDFVGVGVFGGEAAIAQMVDPDPLLIAANIPQSDLASIQRDGKVQVRLSNGDVHDARLRYVASVADATSRSFRVEVEMDNPGYAIPSGLTAEMRLPMELVKAHKVPSSVIALNDAGGVGVKTVDAQGMVHFVPVVVLDEENDGLWVAGLDEAVQLIVLGQAFVNDGQQLDLGKIKRAGEAAEPAAVSENEEH